MLKRAIDQDLLHERDLDWGDQTIARGWARGVINADRLTAFFVVRPIDLNGEPVTYGEACLWKGGDGICRTQAQYALLEEAQRMGSALFGAFYADNDTARAFYPRQHGYSYIEATGLPREIYEEVCPHLDQITLLYNPLDGDIGSLFTGLAPHPADW